MEVFKKLILNRLTGGGKEVQYFDYSSLAKFVNINKAKQADIVEHSIRKLHESGKLDIEALIKSSV